MGKTGLVRALRHDLPQDPFRLTYCANVKIPAYRKLFQQTYGEQHERLLLHQIGFDPSEQTSLFYRSMLSVGTDGNGKTKTQARALFESIIGNHGPGFRHLTYRQIMELVKGQAYYRFKNCGDPNLRDLAFLVNQRPSATWAGGETVTLL